MTLKDVLDAIVKVSNQPLKYRISDTSIIFEPRYNQPLIKRSFKVDPSSLRESLSLDRVNAGSNPNSDMVEGLRKTFAQTGIDLTPPKGIDWNEVSGTLQIEATEQDLLGIEQILDVLCKPPSQVNLNAKLIEIDESAVKILTELFSKNSVNLTTNRSSKPKIEQVPGEDSADGAITGILSRKQFESVLTTTKNLDSTHLVSEASVTTLSGRQTQVEIVTTNGIEDGQVIISETLDMIPFVTTNGDEIHITAIATLPDFLGYDEPNLPQMEVIDNISGSPYGSNGPTLHSSVAHVNTQSLITVGRTKATGLLPLPHFRHRQTVTTAMVQDGHTLMMLLPASTVLKDYQEPHPVLKRLLGTNSPPVELNPRAKRNSLIFITPTLIDPAGNPIHGK